MTLVFVYRADSGLFNTLTDMAHKLFSPATYPCRLCAITYGVTGMREAWRQFINSLGHPCRFLHRDQFMAEYGIDTPPLPAIFQEEGGRLLPWIQADEIEACHDIEGLKTLILKRSSEGGLPPEKCTLIP